MIKKFFLFLFIASIIISCEPEPEFFTITGTVKNANGVKLYLAELQTSNINFVDSVILNDEGSFSFKGKTDIPKFYALRTESNNYITLIVNPLEQITIHANGADLANNPLVEGSPESKKILELRKNLDASVDKLDSLGIYYQSLIGKSEIYKVRDSLRQVSEQIILDHTEFTKLFIIDNSSSLAGLMALYQQIAPRRYVLNPNDHLEYFELVDSSLVSLYPTSEAVKALHSQMSEMKRQINSELESDNITGIGKLAPEIILPSPDGDTILLSSLKGKYVLLDFWASWCRPCRVENPILVKNYKKYNEKGFEIFQVSLDKKKDAWVNAIEKDELTWIHVSDLQYWNSTPAQQYGVQGIPANFLLDRNGRIIAKNLRGDALEAKLSEIFD
ncbi:MAG: AhpC/TSA family protein [Bacteroidales bacterium]|nr:AhpC/TSA family protein [Bacteroidales bacterium]